MKLLKHLHLILLTSLVQLSLCQLPTCRRGSAEDRGQQSCGGAGASKNPNVSSFLVNRSLLFVNITEALQEIIILSFSF